MAIDLDEIRKKFDEALDSPWFEEYCQKIKNARKIKNKQLKRFHDKYSKKLDWAIEKCQAKYSSKSYQDREYKLGFEPREPLFSFLLEYARKHCRPCKNKKYWNMFTGEAYYIGSYVIQIMHGQGSVIRVDKKEKTK